MFDCQFFIHAGKGLVIIMNQMKSVYNSPFKYSHSHPIHTFDKKVKLVVRKMEHVGCKLQERIQDSP